MASYPDALSPHTWYHLWMIPIEGINERIDFFYKYKNQKENLYKGIINSSYLHIEDREEVIKNFKRYFDKCLYRSKSTHRDHLSKKLFPKMCWLTESFFSTGFTEPICVHYNPRIRKNVIHPGTTRSWIIDLFQETKEVSCLYFNTGGVQVPFLKKLQIVEKTELESFDGIFINLAADHGSIIPHVNLNEKIIADKIPVWQDFITNRISDPLFKISMNKTIDLLAPWEVRKELAYIRIDIDDPRNIDDVCRACILAVLGRSYSSKSLTVECLCPVENKPI